MFKTDVYNVDGPFKDIKISLCEGRNSGTHGELLVGYCGTGNCSIIGIG